MLNSVQTFEPSQFKNNLVVSSTFPTTLSDRLKDAQTRLGLTAAQLARDLKITPEWLSKIINKRVAGSEDIGLRLDALYRSRGIEPASTSIVEVNPSYGAAAPSPSGSVAVIRRAAREHFEALLASAGNDVTRMGWIHEQLAQHLQIPAGWRASAVPGGFRVDRPVHEKPHSTHSGKPVAPHAQSAQSA